jgi:hypothetical protein
LVLIGVPALVRQRLNRDTTVLPLDAPGNLAACAGPEARRRMSHDLRSG